MNRTLVSWPSESLLASSLSVPDLTTPGTYLIRYECDNSRDVHRKELMRAVPQMRTVIVDPFHEDDDWRANVELRVKGYTKEEMEGKRKELVHAILATVLPKLNISVVNRVWGEQQRNPKNDIHQERVWLGDISQCSDVPDAIKKRLNMKLEVLRGLLCVNYNIMVVQAPLLNQILFEINQTDFDSRFAQQLKKQHIHIDGFALSGRAFVDMAVGAALSTTIATMSLQAASAAKESVHSISKVLKQHKRKPSSGIEAEGIVSSASWSWTPFVLGLVVVATAWWTQSNRRHKTSATEDSAAV